MSQLTLPPMAVEVEKHVLGALWLGDNSAYAAFDRLKTRDFYSQAHQILFEASLELYRAGKNIDLLTLSELLKGKKLYEAVGGDGYLCEISAEVVSAANCDSHCDILKSKSARRDYISKAQAILEMAKNETVTDEVLSGAADVAFVDIGGEGEARRGPSSARESLMGTLSLIEKAHSGQIQGLQTQFPEFNEKTGGICSPDFVVLAGRPRLGKTALALDMADYMATDHKKNVLMFSLEMTKEQLMQRLICRRQSIDFQALRTGRLARSQFLQVAAAARELVDSRLFIDDGCDSTPAKIFTSSKRHKAQHGLDLIIVDNLSLMESDKRTENRLQEVTSMTRAFKKYAKMLGVPIFVLVHFSRALEYRGEDTIPRLSDLRECGTIEQDADVVMGMHKPDPHGDRTDLYLLKQRNGPEAVIPLRSELQYMRFKPYDGASF